MLSFKDIKIIETTLEPQENTASDKALNKVYSSLTELLTSRFYWEMKSGLSEFMNGDELKSIKVVFNGASERYKSEHDYLKLKNSETELFCTQKDMASLSDLVWRGAQVERVNDCLYRSDIFIVKSLTKSVVTSLQKAVRPLVTLDDFRINDMYKLAISRLQENSKSFHIEFKFSHFTTRLVLQCNMDALFLSSEPEYSNFDVAIVSV